ncbi:trk system potassium uptake protein TrkH [Microbacteriaceae bacterium SG_E_30_P1]|uniref:Trk system potassium uptake protein TrkH n=1 Tax=Antiquaquibacter oligotrophicus TaxID=2880260 RepID=A0ABT6KQH5_9MICO|nr:potassium transporter TrkG [Antiquaquibacter oligotrophicus]MDH6182051.1 trk system potassium uptake protein TrkH [Antiquaquibacter oligotrophicus]UDF12281.1 TrkH family potassium uptake protein [Antiquaquibacter oligotrophicus]
MRVEPAMRTSIYARLRDGIDSFAAATPARFAITIFTSFVLIFTLLFSLPIATSTGRPAPLVDALFTAVSVICVTGLSTVDMATYWSPFGHVLVFIGVEIGGIGVLTLASILGLVISRRLGLRQKLLAAGDANPLRIHKGPISEGQAVRLGETGSLLLTVAVSALIIELAVALLLFPRMLIQGVPVLDAAWQSVYLSAMAFTNTGFLPTSDGLTPYADDPWFLTVLMLGVVLGAIGFPVIYVLTKNLRHPRRWSLHVKITILTFALLLVLGAFAYFVLEYNNPRTFGPMDPGQRVLQSFFLSSMARSGGFSTVDIAQLDSASLLVTDMLMFIGGGSASTAGGIKVTTLAILFLAAFAEARGHSDMEAYDRRIPGDVLRLAVSVVLWGATTVAASCILILLLTDSTLDYVLFDVISAFATCGLTTGFTASTTDSAQYILAATMFFGRIGTVTLAAALAASQHPRLFRRPEERPIVG